MIENTGCNEEGCFEWVFSPELALGQGWYKVGDDLYCATHGPLAALQESNRARREALEVRADAIARRVRNEAARSALTTEDYANWHEFQQDLTNFHRKHGKLAPAPLRVLGPKDFTAQFKKTGKIDVEAVAEALTEEKQTLAQRIADRMR